MVSYEGIQPFYKAVPKQQRRFNLQLLEVQQCCIIKLPTTSKCQGFSIGPLTCLGLPSCGCSSDISEYTDAACILLLAGFNRTGFVVCSYLIEHCGLSVDQALQSFARSRPPGVKHEKFKNELHARYGVRNMHIQRPVHSCGPVCVVCGEASCSTSSSSTAAVNQPSASTAAAADSEYSSAAAVQDCSSGTSAAAEDCTSSGAGQQPAAAAPARTASVLSTGSEQPLAAELRLSRCSSNSSQKPPPPPQLAQLLTSSSIDAYTLPRIPDSSSTPLPVISGRCYSSGSMGDNSSIGCSPDSTADVLLTGTSSNHSSVGYAAGRFPLAAGRQQQQAVVPGLHGFSRRSALQSSSVHSSQGRLGCSAPATAPAAAAVAIDAAAAGSRTGTDSKPQSRNSSGSALASDQCNDADAFDIDPCGEERDDDSSSSWQGDRTAGSTRNGWCAEGPSSEEQQRQQQRQQQQQLSDLMAAVRLGQQQQQQPAGQYCTDVTTAGGNRQQHTADASAAGSAASAATAAVVECSCSCHTAVAAARRSSHDGGVWQTQLRYSLMSTGEGRQPQELADNESFGRVTTADMLMSLR